MIAVVNQIVKCGIKKGQDRNPAPLFKIQYPMKNHNKDKRLVP
jgi:hypothetical protein